MKSLFPSIVILRRLCIVAVCCAMVFGLAGCGGNSAASRGKGNMPGYGMAKTHPDPLTQRRIVMVQPQSGEHLDVIYYHDGGYDAAVMKQINYLFRDRHENVVGTIDPELIDYLVDIRTRLGLPANVTFEILSGYRTPGTNANLALDNKNVAFGSLHMHGWAVDFRIAHVSGGAICEIAKTMQRGGVAFNPTNNHVHVDLGNIRTWHEG
jgi:uncharacterized protein YcbK (DUF882 family)